MLTGNYTPQAIRAIANKEWGFRTNIHKSVGGTQIPLWGIYNLFDNIFYTGMFRWKGTLFAGNHTPMITMAEYNRVQMLLGNKDNPRPQKHSFAYTGLIRCKSCYMTFTATQKLKLVKSSGMKETYVYYHCSRKSKDIRCTNAPISLNALESIFEHELERFEIAPEFAEWALSHMDKEKEKLVADQANIRAMQQNTLQKAERELENLTRMRYQDLIDDVDFIKGRTALKEQITKLQVEMRPNVDNATKWDKLTKRAFLFAAYARQEFINGSIETKRSIISSFGSNYSISDRKLIFEASFWLIPIQKAYSDLYAEFKRVELQKSLGIKGWNTLLQPLVLVLCTLCEEVRTALIKNNGLTISIPTFKK